MDINNLLKFAEVLSKTGKDDALESVNNTQLASQLMLLGLANSQIESIGKLFTAQEKLENFLFSDSLIEEALSDPKAALQLYMLASEALSKKVEYSQAITKQLDFGKIESDLMSHMLTKGTSAKGKQRITKEIAGVLLEAVSKIKEEDIKAKKLESHNEKRKKIEVFQPDKK